LNSSVVTLKCHRTTPSKIEMAVEVEVIDERPQGLALSFRLAADTARLCIPSMKPPVREDGLWNHTCFEVFIRADEGPGYREFNFSPSGAWQAYQFQGYRDGAPMNPASLFPGECCIGSEGLSLGVRIPAEMLPPDDRLRIGLSAVVEESNGRLSYWALHHPSDRPDFHHYDAFALVLDRNR
jgi:hypothetical protein